MDAHVKDVVRECTLASDEERITFPEVVGRLMAAGIERYRADLVRGEKTYYLPGGASEIVPALPVKGAAGAAFSAAGVGAAVRAIQAGRIGYGEFCRRIYDAGCVDYLVSLAGRRAVYCGRGGESYVEPFPPAE